MSPNWEKLHDRHFDDLGFNHDVAVPECVQTCVFYQKVSAYAFVVDGKAIFALVLIKVAPGTVSVLMYPGKELYTYRRIALVALRQDMEEYAVVESINRFEATTKDAPLFRSFMERCGFHIEIPLKKYFNGEDCLLWANFPEKI